MLLAMAITAICSTEDCPLPVHVTKWGLCKNHYEQARRDGLIPSRSQRQCRADDCDRTIITADGLCDRHYRQLLHNGTFVSKRDPELRLWSRVDKDGPIPLARPDLGQCWQWTGPRWKRDYDGAPTYGFMKMNGKNTGVHRIVYELLVDVIPDGLTIDHLCRNMACVNPSHLEPVTLTENILRSDNTAALFARRDSCYRGHSFDPPNGYARPDGARGCHECDRIRGAIARAKRQAL